MIEMSKMYIERSYFGLRVHPFSFSCPGSDEEDDVIGHHDLVVVLHASQSISDLCLGEVLLAALVDVVHQGLHLHRLRVSRLEDPEQ